MSDLSDCPHRPGTPEWKQWQAKWVRAESQRRSQAGEYGATAEDKVAAGLPATETVKGNGEFFGYRRLSDFAEPWRSQIEKRLRIPPEAKPLQCPWCRKQYKRQTAFTRHKGLCNHPNNPRSDLYTSGDCVPLVGTRNGRWEIVGYDSTPQRYERWRAEAEEGRRQAQAMLERFGREAVEAVAVAVGSRKNPARGLALGALAAAEKHGWRPPEQPSTTLR